jgi:hypothetical protein
MGGPLPQIFALEEDLLVADDAIVLETGQDAHLVERVLDFLLGEVRQFHFLQRVDLAIGPPLDAEDLRVRTLASVIPHVPSFGPSSKSFSDINNYKAAREGRMA